MFLRTHFIIVFIGIASYGVAQQNPPHGTPRSSANSLHPGETPSVETQKKVNHRISRRKGSDPVQDYYDRMEDVAKAYRRAEKLSRKPRYSNPLYFGHKRPPRKHSPEKMRYCKECGIRH
jgi:hypothetical protein